MRPDEAPDADPDDPRRWTFRAFAIAILLVQAMFTIIVYPPQERYFYAPDDRDTYVYAKAVWENGLPAIPADVVDAKLPGYGRFVPPATCSHSPQDECVSPRAPGIFYLMSPFASSPLVAAYGEMLLCLCAQFLVFLYLQRHLGGGAATVGLVTLAGSACMVFWTGFLMSNGPALGVLFGGLLLMDRRSAWPSAAGTFLVVASVLMRQDYAILVAVLGAGWSALVLPGLVKARAWPLVAAVVGGAAAAASMVYSLCMRLYGTWNFVAVARRTDTDVAGAVTGVLDQTHKGTIEKTLAVYLLVFLIAFLGLVPLAGARRKRWPALPMAVAGALSAAYFLSTGFAKTRVLMASSYTRYMLPVVAFGAFGIALLWNRLKGPERIITLCVVGLSVGASIGILLSDEGLPGVAEITKERRAIAELTDHMDNRTVFAATAIYTDRVPVLRLLKYDTSREQKELFPALFGELHEKGYTILAYKDAQGNDIRRTLVATGDWTVSDWKESSRVWEFRPK